VVHFGKLHLLRLDVRHAFREVLDALGRLHGVQAQLLLLLLMRGQGRRHVWGITQRWPATLRVSARIGHCAGNEAVL
jgi:hypothetical protein